MNASLTPVQQPTVVVSGVSSGIGLGIASYLTQAGYSVFGTVRSEKDAIIASGTLTDNFRPLVVDIRNRDEVRAAQEQVRDQLKERTLTGLVNNAGLAAFGPLEILDNETFEDVVSVGLMGTRNMINAFLPLLRSRNLDEPGKIINISSLSGILNTPMNGAYCVAKHALESLGEVYRRELLPAGIDVVSIRSGPIQSQIWRKSAAKPEDYEDPDYQIMAQSVRRVMQDAELRALPASVIAETIGDILQGRKTGTAYHLSHGAWTARVLASLPDRWADRLIARSLLKRNSNNQKSRGWGK